MAKTAEPGKPKLVVQPCGIGARYRGGAMNTRTIRQCSDIIGAEGADREWTSQARLDRKLFRMSLAALRLPRWEFQAIVEDLGPDDFREFQTHLANTQRRYKAGLAVLKATQELVADSLAELAGEGQGAAHEPRGLTAEIAAAIQGRPATVRDRPATLIEQSSSTDQAL
jgi:hypothetical protein